MPIARYQLDAPCGVDLGPIDAPLWHPRVMQPADMLDWRKPDAVGIDPGKHTINACRLWREAAKVTGVQFLRIDWTTADGWDELCGLFGRGPSGPRVASETQWADKSILDRWDGVQECVQTTGVIRAASVAQRNPVNLWTPGEWRKVLFEGRAAYHTRRLARQAEQAFACSLLCVPAVQPDMSAALCIALAQATFDAAQS